MSSFAGILPYLDQKTFKNILKPRFSKDWHRFTPIKYESINPDLLILTLTSEGVSHDSETPADHFFVCVQHDGYVSDYESAEELIENYVGKVETFIPLISSPEGDLSLDQISNIVKPKS